ncbi:accessory Sec system protein Asp1 [Macrococcoides goetzii]|uniref:Accessory Sec system protein Asp1 n=1 Tax=Macrococcoides goetzii TaxID=1891097 RepID=A0A2G5NVK1_9STAP|nr:accessory Sec system protein Asp1 [Macrococcus goetzii]RAI78919.1 accessory Sec system protein Asp1 [Macrococcus goetzii]
MKHFIPAWYYEDNKWWLDRSVPFYNKKHQSEFDDMISLMNMHQKNKYPFKLITLNYHSSLRTFLHRHQLYEVDYWSLFDVLQGFEKVTPKPLDYRTFNWSEQTEFIYTPFIIKAVDGNVVTNIYYDPDGYLIWMEQFIDDVKLKRFVFDDRGYLSSIIDFKDEECIHYLNADGDIILTEYLSSGRVDVVRRHALLKEKSYPSMAHLIEMCWQDYVKHPDDTFIVAADVRHNALISRHVDEQQLMFSVFQTRNDPMTNDWLSAVQGSYRLIVDTMKNERRMNQYVPSDRLFRITPFDAEVLPSISSQLYVNYIGVFIDGITDEVLHELLDRFEYYMEHTNQLRLKLMSRTYQSSIHQDIQMKMATINQKFLEKEEDFEDLLDKEKREKQVIQWVDISHEVNIIKWMAKFRVMVDLTAEPDLYIQIAAISAGVPQINMLATDYVTHEKNGYIVSDINQLSDGLDYYLKQLKHWNEAYSYSMSLTEKFSSVNIINQLDRFVKGDQHETSIQNITDR